MTEWRAKKDNCRQKYVTIPIPMIFYSVRMSQKTSLILVFLSGMVVALIATLLPNFQLWFLNQNKRQIAVSRPGIQSHGHMALNLPFTLRRKNGDDIKLDTGILFDMDNTSVCLI